MSDNSSNTPYYHIGLIVTGEGEREFIPKLFKTLMATAPCYFEVIRKISQLSPITSEKRKLAMVGKKQAIPQKDVELIGIPARHYLKMGQNRLVILLDDLEHDRETQAEQVFQRYRTAFDEILKEVDDQRRVSVHFLVYMLEAYYFAHAEALSTVTGLKLEDYSGDVETIRHPKNDIKRLCPGFDEVRDGEKVLDSLDVEYVLQRPDTCGSLRTLFAWCCEKLGDCFYEPIPVDKYRKSTGKLSKITRHQLPHSIDILNQTNHAH